MEIKVGEVSFISLAFLGTITIVNGCEVWIENSVMRVTDSCHDSYPEWRNFQFAPNNHHWLFFLHTFPSTIVFKLDYVLFYQLYAKMCTFSIKKCLVQHLSTSWSHARGRLTPPRVRRKYPEWVEIVENLVGYARKRDLLSLNWTMRETYLTSSYNTIKNLYFHT